MCGIAGHLSRETSDGILEKMLGRIKHRGPDGQGSWSQRVGSWNVHLGHRRLSIIDLKTGSQPLSAGGAQITFNGEIYNYRELREKLSAEGISFTTQSDTEVLLQTILAKGIRAGLESLNGMFAFALWHNGSLFLARDRAGIKPLYYSHAPSGELIFASELSAMLEHPAVSRKIDPAGLAEFFFLDYTQPPLSLLRDVKKLEPGCFLEWKDGALSSPQRYWQLQERPPVSGEENLAKELWARLDRAVSRQLQADVPVGVLLSGGLDSSAIAAIAAAKSKDRLRTFSIGFADPAFDESAHSRRMAAELNSFHTERTFDETSLLDGMENILASLDEPLADPSLLPTSLLAQMAAEQVKVVLGGDGGDELWAGYPTYRAQRMAEVYRALPEVLRKKIIPWAVGKLPVQDGHQTFDWKAKRFAGRWDDDPVRRHLRWMSNTDVPELGQVSSLPGFGLEPLWENLRSFNGNGLALDFQTYLPGSVLAKVDRASMAHGLEVRPPFLDAEFVDWSFSIPASLKLRNGEGKYLLKRAAAPWLPAEIIHRRKKGFGIPLASWLRGPLAAKTEEILRDSPLWDFLNQETFQKWQREHLARRADRSKPLWAMIVIDRWVKRFGCE